MARRGMAGQLNMFDFFNSLDVGAPGEVEMVSLVPSFDEEPDQIKEEPEVEEIPEPEEVLEVEEFPVSVEKQAIREDLTVAMSRTYEQDGKKIEIAYINYNKVRITKGDGAPIIREFASTKEAVDYYVEQMQGLEADG